LQPLLLYGFIDKKPACFKLNSNYRFHNSDVEKGACLSFFGSIGVRLRTRLQNTKEFYLFVMQVFRKTMTFHNYVKQPDTWFGLRYNLNLYRGCQHQCIYCDSRSDCYHIFFPGLVCRSTADSGNIFMRNWINFFLV